MREFDVFVVPKPQTRNVMDKWFLCVHPFDEQPPFGQVITFPGVEGRYLPSNFRATAGELYVWKVGD